MINRHHQRVSSYEKEGGGGEKEEGRQYRRRLITPRPLLFIYFFPSQSCAPVNSSSCFRGSPAAPFTNPSGGSGEFLRLPGGWVETKGVDSVPFRPAPVQGKDRSCPQAYMSGVHSQFPFAATYSPEGPQLHFGPILQSPKPPPPVPACPASQTRRGSSESYLPRAHYLQTHA